MLCTSLTQWFIFSRKPGFNMNCIKNISHWFQNYFWFQVHSSVGAELSAGVIPLCSALVEEQRCDGDQDWQGCSQQWGRLSWTPLLWWQCSCTNYYRYLLALIFRCGSISTSDPKPLYVRSKPKIICNSSHASRCNIWTYFSCLWLKDSFLETPVKVSYNRFVPFWWSARICNRNANLIYTACSLFILSVKFCLFSELNNPTLQSTIVLELELGWIFNSICSVNLNRPFSCTWELRS